MGGARGGKVALTMSVALMLVAGQSCGATLARAEEPGARLVTATVRATRYVLVHDGRSISVAPVGDHVGATQLSIGRYNDRSKGYAILAEGDGSLLVVRYRTAASGTTHYTVRHVDAEGRVDWARELTAAPTGDAPREIAVAPPRVGEAVATVTP